MNTYLSTDHLAIQCFTELMVKHGITKAIISSGSRNAPFVIALANRPSVTCLSITDERSAAFFALGMAQQSHRPVVLICTSGTAVLNYTPAVAEAFYQYIPLIIVSADRPENLVDQAEGQAIRQHAVLKNHVLGSYTFPVLVDEKKLPLYNRQINEAIIRSKQLSKPVHLNFHLKEPLYGKIKYRHEVSRMIRWISYQRVVKKATLQRLSEEWNLSKNIMILAGFHNPDDKLQQYLAKIADNENVIILTENITNLHHPRFITAIDRTIAVIKDKKAAQYRPDLLITFGGTLVSKMMKAFLRKYTPDMHWQISCENYLIDTYDALTNQIPMQANVFFQQILPYIRPVQSKYRSIWQQIASNTSRQHRSFVKNCIWSDLKAFDSLLNVLPKYSDLQLGNSTVVRYTQLFDVRKDICYFSNRGTSGIEGSLSTAAGAVYISRKVTTVIVGDLSFLYDSNALWNNYLHEKLKIIIINNGGGGIFRFIDGPSESGLLERFFETTHNYQFGRICEQYNIRYYFTDNENDINDGLNNLYADNDIAVLEIKTPREKNAKVLMQYFESLSSS